MRKINIINDYYEDKKLLQFEKDYRYYQIFDWINHKGIYEFSNMSNLGKSIKEQINERFYCNDFIKYEHLKDRGDGAEKFLWTMRDGEKIETVFLPNNWGNTVCLSTQVGCALGCSFCMTGKNGLVRNLTVSEIVLQYIQAMQITGKSIRNIVFMGMGEPLNNYDNLVNAINYFTSEKILTMSPSRITVSTAGILGKLNQFIHIYPRVNIAISINSLDSDTRTQLMPINKKYPIGDIRLLYKLTKGDITFEYVLINGVNDTEEDAIRLAKFARRHRALVNLIPLNEHRNIKLKKPDKKRILRFDRIIHEHKVTVRLRNSYGQSIAGACGHLRAKSTAKPGDRTPERAPKRSRNVTGRIAGKSTESKTEPKTNRRSASKKEERKMGSESIRKSRRSSGGATTKPTRNHQDSRKKR